MSYVKIVEEEEDEPIELPAEEDGTLLLSTVTAQFPTASGLKYRCLDPVSIRGIRLTDDRFYAPPEGWGAYNYIIVSPKCLEKRKGDSADCPVGRKKLDLKCTDLIVLGLPWKTTEDDLKDYFTQFGELVMVQLKRDPGSQMSKGYGFVRFADYDKQYMVLNMTHTIDGRICNVRIPNSKEGQQSELSPKIYVGHTTDDMTVEEIREYFQQFGSVVDVFIPKPFRAFAFVTFSDPYVAQALHGDEHSIKGIQLHIASATPKTGNENVFEKSWYKSQAADAYQNERNSAQLAAAMAAAQAVFSQGFLSNSGSTNTRSSSGGGGGNLTTSKDQVTYGPYGSTTSSNGSSWSREGNWHPRT